MKLVISMKVDPENDIVRAEFSVFNPDRMMQDETVFQAAEITADFLHKRLQEVNVPDTLEFDFQMHTDGTYHISVSVPDKRILKEVLNGKTLDLGDLYSTEFPKVLQQLFVERGLSGPEDADILFTEPQKLKFINDDVKLSKFILAVIFVTCGIGVSVYGITLFNLSIIDVVFGKIGGLISMLGGIVFLGIFGYLFNQPGGRR